MRARLYLVFDLILTELAMLIATAARPHLPFGVPLSAEQVQNGLWVYVSVAAIWSAAFLLLSTHRPGRTGAIAEIYAVVVATSLASLTLAAILFLSLARVSRLLFLTFYVLDVVLLAGLRLAVKAAGSLRAPSRPERRRVLILGAGAEGRDTVQMIDRAQRRRSSDLQPVGFLDDSLPVGDSVAGYPVLGRIRQVTSLVELHEVEEVVVALPLAALDRFFHLLDALQRLPVRIHIIPDYIKTTLIRTRIEEFAGVPMIIVQKPTLTPFERKVKRAFDLAFGTATLLAVSPFLGLIALAIRLDTPGPAIFRQRRVGENGQIFWMYKFRTMIQDAEDQEAEALREMDDAAAYLKVRDDPRVTRVGRTLRRTSLDELPQLINVLKGDMSTVGPRPELPRLVERTYQLWQWQRFAVPQGITGWWQVNGRSDKPMHLHTEQDLFYIQHYSLLMDIQILLRTLEAVIKRQGAY